MPSKQAPIPSGFGPTTTPRQVLKDIDLTGKIAIVTGGYSGIGLETTRALAEAGATVIVPARTPDKARQALNNIPRVEQSRLDLLDPDSIDAFAHEFLASGRPSTSSSTTPALWQRRSLAMPEDTSPSSRPTISATFSSPLASGRHF